jgi:DNA repair exonuclease SbcCD ATPase subunit
MILFEKITWKNFLSTGDIPSTISFTDNTTNLIVSAMNNLIKEDIRQNRETIRSLDIKKNAAKDKVEMQENFIEDLEARGMETINNKYEKIKEIDLDIDALMLKNRKLNHDLDEKQEEVSKFANANKKLRQLGNIKGTLSQKVSTLTENHKFFEENTVCPTCKQGIEESFRLDRIVEAQSKLQELKEGFQKLEESIKEEENRELQFTNLSKEVTSLTHGISQNNTRISGLQRQSRDLQSEIQTITDQLQNRNSEHEKLEEYREGLQSIFNQLAKKKEEVNYQSFAYDLLKDGGVKTKIIKKYLPLINQQVNRYLQLMDFYINFKLDEEFNETIKSPIHDKFSYSSFSEGEKMRIDLALLFTWREVARFKNSANTNLLIMDEVFDSSLDGFGTDDFLKIIRFVIKDANIFVISHKTEMYDKFQNVIKFEKFKGFSKMVS